VILKFKNNYRKSCLFSILFICVFQSETVLASREPIIRVLISKNIKKNIHSVKIYRSIRDEKKPSDHVPISITLEI